MSKPLYRYNWKTGEADVVKKWDGGEWGQFVQATYPSAYAARSFFYALSEGWYYPLAMDEEANRTVSKGLFNQGKLPFKLVNIPAEPSTWDKIKQWALG